MPAMRLWTFALAVLLLGSLVAAPARAQVPDLRAAQQEVVALTLAAQEIARSAEQRVSENTLLLRRLAPSGPETAPTLQQLRQAQFEVDIARARLQNLEHTIAAHLAEQERRSAALVQQTVAATTGDRMTLAALVEQSAIRFANEARIASEAVSAAYRDLQDSLEDTLNLRREQLAILQSAADLSTVFADMGAEPVAVPRLRGLVSTLNQRARALTAEAAEAGDLGGTVDANLRRVRADEATLRASARLTDVEIVTARSLERRLALLADEKAVPLRLFSQAIEALTSARGAMVSRLEVSASIRGALGDLKLILRSDGDTATQNALTRLDALSRLLTNQDVEIAALREKIGATIGVLAGERATRERATLFDRQVARTDAAGRARIGAELTTLPAALHAVYVSRLTEVRTALSVATTRQNAGFALAVIALLAVVTVLRQRVLRQFIAAEGTIATEIPLEVLRRNLFWLMPAAIWVVFCLVYAVSRDTAIDVGRLLAIPSAMFLLIDLTHVIVERRKGSAAGLGRLITRATAVAMLLTAVVVFAYLLVADVALLPSTQLAVNRLAYSVFVLGGLPMLLFVVFFAKGTAADGAGAQRLVASALALVPPTALIATGVAGLAGYSQLAAIMLEDLALTVTIVATLFLGLGILNDLLEGVALRLRRKDPAQAYFVRQNFIVPAKRVLQLALVLVAVVVAGQLFEWTAQSFGIKEALAFWRFPLFSAGGGTYSIGNVIIAVAAFVFVFWAAAWARRVAYSVILRKLKDIGIRQSLSVFAQYVVIVIGVLLTLSLVGFDVTTLTVFAASLGVGIGFGMQNVVNNFISGLLLLVERPLRLGDIVTVGTTSGTVSQIGIRSMRMRTFDEFDLIVPNSALVSDTFTNWTRSNTTIRVLKTVGISYNDDPQEAVAIVTKILQDHPGVVASPAPLVTVEEFGDNSINLRVCYYCDLRGAHPVFVIKSEVYTAIHRTFGERGLSIPFPQRDVHVIAPKGPADARPPAGPLVQAPPTADRDWRADAIDEILDEAGKDGG
ncbi:MAG: mechanosensitive ion channel domain-containing protein [Pseudomonadota bacterium]